MIKNRTIFQGDNLDVLRGFNDNSIDLIYLDPPFNKKKQFIAPIGSDAEGAEFKDYWGLEDIKDAWIAMLKESNFELYNFLDAVGKIGNKSNKYYLVYMAMRLLELKRILKDTGSIYLHCDNTMGHYLKLLMDTIFGEKNFRNEIVWQYFMGGKSKKFFARKHDTIFFYTKNSDYYFNFFKVKRYLDFKPSLKDESQDNASGKDKFGYWSMVGCPDVWSIKGVFNLSKERVGYPTQKPIALLERIIKASCPEGGLVLDPFCGCATTCVASEKLGRQWIGIDISKKAYELVNIRLHKEIANPEELFKYKNILTFRTDIPMRTDIDIIKLQGKFKQEIKQRLYGLQAGNCKGCDQHFHIIHFEIDHIIPKAKGGTDHEDNLQLLCSYCNRVKGAHSMEYLRSKIAEVRESR